MKTKSSGSVLDQQIPVVISAEEAAAIGGVHRKTVLLWCRKGLFVAGRRTTGMGSSRWRICRDSYLKFLGLGAMGGGTK